MRPADEMKIGLDAPYFDSLRITLANRELTKAQRAALGARVLQVLRAQNPDHKGTGIADRAAEISGSSRSAVNRARRLFEVDQALFMRVEAGELGLFEAIGDAEKRELLKPITRDRSWHEQLRKLAKAGRTAPEIAAELGMSHARIHSTAKKLGIELTLERAATEDRLEDIKRLARDGHRAEQIAQILRVTPGRVRDLAHHHRITLPDAALGRVHTINPRRVIERIVHGLSGDVTVIGALKASPFPDIEPEEARHLAASLATTMRSLSWLHRELARRCNGDE